MKGQIIDTIKQYNTIVIHRHVRPDPDAYGSQIGLKLLLQHNYPEKRILAAGEHEQTLDYLAAPDHPTDADFKDALVIVTDTANTERVDDARYSQGSKVIKIDHHPNDDAYGDLVWVDTAASSASELVYDLYTYGKQTEDWRMPDEAARLLYAGILGDTGRFMFPSTTKHTFEAAGDLVSYSFDREVLHNAMYELESHLLQLQGYLFQHTEISGKGCAYVKLSAATLAKFGVTPSETSLLVGSLGAMKGIRVWAIFIEEGDEIRVRLRSKGPVINELAKEFGGGGHPRASGATVYSWEEADEFIGRLQEICSAG
ncbi:DHH family phosphoesterase [Planococcus lenghuensis]|uniref:DHH family phosphoesterase n=1 Tax=Planococcus lenghuensis TaxID=2213202 RepID=UPI0012EB2931|nr:bifunctional oligoribonuclease/PAP phosphatase NrnA [Planococcus lenghuensis]